MLKSGLAIGLLACASIASAQTASDQTAGEALPAPAAPSGDIVFDDLKCFVVMGNPPADAPPEVENSFALIAVYFTGKLFGRDPGFNLEAADSTYSARMDTMDYQAEMMRCVGEFDNVGNNLQAYGNAD